MQGCGWEGRGWWEVGNYLGVGDLGGRAGKACLYKDDEGRDRGRGNNLMI